MLLDYKKGKVGSAVPRLFYYEIANAVYIAIQIKRINEDDGTAIIRDMLVLETMIIDSPELLKTAYLDTRKHNISVYDAVYLALANEQDCPCYPGDRKFYNTVKHKK